MEITIARTYKNELQKKVAELIKEFEKTSGLEVNQILVVRQGQFDSLGNEVDFNYAVEAKVNL